jgi:non-canonical poly(A) RNA polymerase PAPD5/7
VELFGSYVTDLFVPSSDIDMVIFETGVERIDSLFTLSRELERRGICKNPEVITWAKIPIIKIKDLRSGGCLVDISFDLHHGPQNATIIKSYMQEYPFLKPLSLIIKYYLKQKYLNDPWNGGIGSYTLVLMIISFLQVHVSNRSEDVNLAQLLIEFFDLYGTKFDYITQTISVLQGKYISKVNLFSNFKIDNPNSSKIKIGTMKMIQNCYLSKIHKIQM